MGDTRSPRSRLADFIGDAAFDVATFQATYRRSRIVVAGAVVVFVLTIGLAWLEHKDVAIPLLLALACTIPIHAYLDPKASWERMAVIDGALYTVMLVVAGLPELIGMVMMAQMLLGVLFVRGAVAIRLSGISTIIATVGFAIAISFDFQVHTPGQRITFFALIAIMSVIPSLWGLLAAGNDIRASAAKTERLSREKDELLDAKDRFVASVSHELRTPLTAVVGLARTLAEAQPAMLEAERQELLELVADESEQVAALVDDLLVIARLQGGTLSIDSESVEISPLVVHASRIWDRPVAVTCGPKRVWGDPVRIRQIVRNLVSNARRYGGPNLEVDVVADGGWVAVQVRDDGDGVSAARADEIFEPYGRAHHRPGRTDSVGLGLTVSRELAELMGGSVDYSRRDGWTIFELRLPHGHVSQLPMAQSLASDIEPPELSSRTA